MKTIRTYLQGCTWCNATGFVRDITPDVTGNWNNVCPVCNGSKTIPVVETFEDESEDQPKKIMMTSEEYYGIKPR